ncbi:MAG TPA: hypothetical protein VIL37_21455 [Natronosporangium sp.]
MAIVNLAAIGLVATPSEAQVITCTSSLSDQTVTATLVVPSGQFCQLTNVEVNGRAEVQASADLFLEDSRIRGSLTVFENSFVQANESRVDGMTTLTDAFGLYSTSSRFDRLIDADGGFIFSDDSTHWGGIRSENGETIVEKGVVLGSVTTTGDRLTDLFDTAVFGPVSVNGAEYGSVVCHMGAALSVTIRNSGGVIQLGFAGPVTGCGFNLMGSLGVHDNIGANIQITGNLIAGNLSCTGNDPAPFGSSNLVGGSKSGQCASLQPAPASVASVIQEEEASAPRADHVLTLIQQRLGS